MPLLLWSTDSDVAAVWPTYYLSLQTDQLYFKTGVTKKKRCGSRGAWRRHVSCIASCTCTEWLWLHQCIQQYWQREVDANGFIPPRVDEWTQTTWKQWKWSARRITERLYITCLTTVQENLSIIWMKSDMNCHNHNHNAHLLASVMNNINHQNTNLRWDAKWRDW